MVVKKVSLLPTAMVGNEPFVRATTIAWDIISL